MATIRKRMRRDGTAAYAVTWREKSTGRQTSRTFSTEVDARVLADFLTANKNHFGLASRAAARMRSAAPTVDTVVRTHIDSLTAIAPATRIRYTRIYQLHMRESLGSIPVDQLTHSDIGAWFTALPLAAGSKKNAHALLSAALKRAVAGGVIPTNPAAGIRAPREFSKRQPIFLTPAQIHMILERAPARAKLFLSLLAASGLRYGEAAALRWQDIDMRGERAVVHVRRSLRYQPGGAVIAPPKTRAGVRSVTLPTSVSAQLCQTYSERMAAGGAPGDIIFTTRTGGYMYNADFHNYFWWPLMRAIAVDLGCRPRVHDLRHTHASRLIDAGVPLPVIQKRLGHESIMTTVGTYGHLAVDADAQAAAALE